VVSIPYDLPAIARSHSGCDGRQAWSQANERLSSPGDKEVTMSDVDDNSIVKLGQRISEQNEILQMIATSLQGVESHLRQMAVSSNPAPNYQRPLSEYPTFDWPSIDATVLNWDGDGATAVEWNGQVFTRRSPANKFDVVIARPFFPQNVFAKRRLNNVTGKRKDSLRRDARDLTI
jgi:ssDNA-binding DdrB-like protein